MIAFVAAAGYGLGYEIPKLLGWPDWQCLAVCFVVGFVMDFVVGRIIFSRVIHPVIVLFYHGDFAYGGSADPLMDGSNLIRSCPDVVGVSFNFRLGLFGFIDFSEIPGGEAYPDALNLGLLDQIAALRWIRENIAAFGGDAMRFYNNEIKGINAIGWELFPKALLVSDDGLRCGPLEDKLTEIKGLLEFIGNY